MQMIMMKKQSSQRSNWLKVQLNSIASEEAEEEHVESFAVTKARPSIFIHQEIDQLQRQVSDNPEIPLSRISIVRKKSSKNTLSSV